MVIVKSCQVVCHISVTDASSAFILKAQDVVVKHVCVFFKLMRYIDPAINDLHKCIRISLVYFICIKGQQITTNLFNLFFQDIAPGISLSEKF
jgi:hypothetical protein